MARLFRHWRSWSRKNGIWFVEQKRPRWLDIFQHCFNWRFEVWNHFRAIFKIDFLAASRFIFIENLKMRLLLFRIKISQTTMFQRSIRRLVKIPAPPRASSATIPPTKTTTWLQLKKSPNFRVFHSSILYSLQKNITHFIFRKTAEKNRKQVRNRFFFLILPLKNYFLLFESLFSS